MIKIKINGKKELIPSSNKLTVKQYVELSKKTWVNDIDFLIKYLSIVLKKPEREIEKANSKGTLGLIFRIGKIQDYTELKAKKRIVINDEVYSVGSDNFLIGERYVIEEAAKQFEDEELMCFILAEKILNINQMLDFEKANKLKDKLMDMPYIEVLPTAFFLQKRLIRGYLREMSFSKRMILLMRMRVLRNKQELKNLSLS